MRASSLLLAGSLLLASGCYSTDEGVSPPLDRFYFPVGLALTPQASRLYVVNSDFDLQYSSGVLQVLDLERLRSYVPVACSSDDECPASRRCDLEPTEANGGVPSRWCVDREGTWAGAPCGPRGEASASERSLAPGRCRFLDPAAPADGSGSLFLGAVRIGAFATDAVYRSRPPGDGGAERAGGRLFVPVRGDATLHWIDVEDDSKSVAFGRELECGQDGNDNLCDTAHRAGDDEEVENTRDARMPPEPFSVAADATGQIIATTHQTEGSVAVFLNDWGDDYGPRLSYIETGLPLGATGLVQVPVPAAARLGLLEYDPGVLVSFRNSAQIWLLRYHDDPDIEPLEDPDVRLTRSGAVPLTVNASGVDTRGVACGDWERRECERACGDDECLLSCAHVPVRVYAASRSPASLLVGQTTAIRGDVAYDLPLFEYVVPLPVGPSRVVVGNVVDTSGTVVPRIFIVSFDSRTVAIYDPFLGRVEKWIIAGRGPHAFTVDIDPSRSVEGATDPAWAYAYIGHFTDSYVGVVDLDQRHGERYGEVVLTVGAPTQPRAAK